MTERHALSSRASNAGCSAAGAAGGSPAASPSEPPVTLPRFAGHHDWPGIDTAVDQLGGVIVEGLLGGDRVAALNAEIDAFLAAASTDAALPCSGSGAYDDFLGHRTFRLHGLIEKTPSAAALIEEPAIVAWAERAMAPIASSVLLNAGELIQIQPGEPAQAPHRDSFSWPLPVGRHPFIVNAIFALDDTTLENGATWVAPESHGWPDDPLPEPDAYARATMRAGDALLFRGDVIHHGGANRSESRRRCVSISFCAGWLRPVENSFLNLSRETVAALSPKLRALLGYAAYDDSDAKHGLPGGMVGLYENGDPGRVLEAGRGRGADR